MAASSQVVLFQSSCLRDLARWVDEKPDSPALLAPGQAPVSFAALTSSIARVAGMLRSAGVRSGDVVAVSMPDGAAILPALLGAVEAAAAAPLDWQLTESEFRSRLALLKASVLIVRSESDGQAASVARSLNIPVIEMDNPADCQVSRSERVTPENCAMLMQTSGTSGNPKLVPLTHTNLRAMGVTVENGLQLRADDRYMSVMPLFHILGFVSALGQLTAGGSVACTGFDPLKFLSWFEEMSPTWYAAGPALHRSILEIAERDPDPFRRSRLRFVRCGSGAGSRALLNQLEHVLQVSVVNGYGLTEVGCAANTPPGLPRKPGSVGRAVGPEVAIMDARGDFLPAEAEGEVVLRGAAVMEGYLGGEQANRDVFLHGWFRTGDLGRLDGDGDLFITGRIKEVINRGGETISPLEIDHALAEHPGILRAASFGVAHPTLGEDIVAAVVSRPGVLAVASQIRSFLARRLSRSKVPSRIWFVESIPLSASGKPLRGALRTQFESSTQPLEALASSTDEDASTVLLRGRIGELWATVLHSDLPGAEDNFFAMGGDSLSAARLFTLLAGEFQLDEAALDLPKFLDSPTFLQLVELVAGKPDPSEVRFEDVSAVCLGQKGDGPPIFFFPGEGLGPWSLRHLARCLGEHQPFFALRHQLTDPADFAGIASRFVTLISRIRPDGPIVLAGHCYGGILAYEIAQQMLAMSRFAVAVVLIDAATPGYRRVRANLPVALRAVLRGDGQKLGAELAGHFRFVRGKNSKSHPGPPASRPVMVPESMRAPEVPQRVRGRTPAGIVLRTYRPRPFPGLLVHALSGGGDVGERILQDSKRGWRKLARGTFEERSLRGTHNSILDAEHAPALASFIQSAVRVIAKAGTAVP